MRLLARLMGSTIVFPLVCLAAAAMIFISEASHWRSVRTLGQLDAMAAAQTTIHRLEQGLVEAESAQRGYLLTQRREYLQPFDAALLDTVSALSELELHFQPLPAAKPLLAQLRQQTEAKRSELALTIELHDRGRVAASRDLVLSNMGKEQMQAVQALSADLLHLETTRLDIGQADILHTLMLRRWGTALLTVVSLVALLMYLRQIAALKREQLRLKASLQAERDRLEVEVANRTAELTELARHLQTAREDERASLARDLHDELGALLTSAKLDAARIRSRLAGHVPLATAVPEALERLAHLVATLNSGIALKRRIVEDLHPSALANLGLVETLTILGREFADRSGIAVACELQAVALAPACELVAYRVVQEAITNISKHAQAQRVWITLGLLHGEAVLGVRDDGVGFDGTPSAASAHGLLGMRFRVESVGGQMHVSSRRDGGTHIAVRLPTAPPPTAERSIG